MARPVISGPRDRVLPGEGEPCPDDVCADGLSCDDERVCRAPLGRDDPCEVTRFEDFTEDDCGRGLYCGPGDTCVDQLPAGADCIEDRECESWSCLARHCDDEGAGFDYCDPDLGGGDQGGGDGGRPGGGGA